MRPWFLLSLMLLLSLLACDQEGLTPGPELESGQTYLNYDGDNLDAPQLPGGGFYEAAIRFSQADLSDQVGDQLVSIAYYIEERPESASLRVYRGGDDEGPGELLYEEDVTSSLRRRRWLTHDLSQALTLPDDNLWIAIRFSHPDAQRTLGCDPGPADPSGDWLYDSFDEGWIPLSERTTGSIDINWNLRGIVSGS